MTDKNTWVEYRNKKKCIADARNDTFILPMSPFPPKLTLCSPGRDPLHMEKGRVRSNQLYLGLQHQAYPSSKLKHQLILHFSKTPGQPLQS